MDTAPAITSPGQRIAAYRLIAELLVYPEQRDRDAIEAQRRELDHAPAPLREPLDDFLAAPRAEDPDEYLHLLELAPPCPLYLGAYLFDEPSTCRGVALSGRNTYMLELAGIYGHFGFQIQGELADFVPAVAEFLALSLAHRELDGIGLRRRLLEHYVRPGLAPMRAALEKYETPYALVIRALEATIDDDIAASADEPIWTPPQRAAPVHEVRIAMPGPLAHRHAGG